MIKHFEYNQIDKAKWDNCIENSVNGTIYAYSWYLDIVSEKWEAIIEDDYKSVLPLTIGNKFGIKYLYQPYFTQQLGVFSINKIDYNIVQSFLNYISENYKFIEINLNSQNKVSIQFSEISKWSFKENINCELKLGNKYEIIKNNYSTNHKRNLKKAEQSGLLIVKDISCNEIINLFKNNRGRDLDNFQEKEYKRLNDLTDAFREKGLLKTYGVFDFKRELCAGAIFAESNSRDIFLFSGNNKIRKETGAMHLLIDNYIKENSERNIILDFEGSNDVNLARFYKGFGAIENKYLTINKNSLPLHIRTTVNFIKWFKKNSLKFFV